MRWYWKIVVCLWSLALTEIFLLRSYTMPCRSSIFEIKPGLVIFTVWALVWFITISLALYINDWRKRH